MIYKCSFEEIDLELMQLLGHGEEGKSYLKNNFVYKIYSDKSIDLNSCLVLTKLKTKRIFLPVDVIYDLDDNYSGYKSFYISPLDDNDDSIISKSVDYFFLDLDDIKKDLDVLRENRVVVGDFGTHNMIDNGHINIFDVGCYFVDFNHLYSNREIENIHFNELNNLVRDILEERLEDICDGDNEYFERVSSYLERLARVNGYVRMLEESCKGYYSVGEFVSDVCFQKVKR